MNCSVVLLFWCNPTTHVLFLVWNALTPSVCGCACKCACCEIRKRPSRRALLRVLQTGNLSCESEILFLTSDRSDKVQKCLGVSVTILSADLYVGELNAFLGICLTNRPWSKRIKEDLLRIVIHPKRMEVCESGIDWTGCQRCKQVILV